MTYAPRPIDTSRVELSPEIRELTEKLAQHVHDVWAQRRLAEGWERGSRLDGVRKQHPLLIPYADLDETDKDDDRQVALEILRALLALGYRIERVQEMPDLAL